MGIISCMGEDYTAPEIDIQSDSSATNLIDDEIPTGQTIKSYLNSNFVQFEEVSDLNKPLTDNIITSLCMYRSGAANKPTGNAGAVLTCVPNANSYACQFAFELGGQIWYRLRNGSGTISAWAQKV